MKINGYKFGHPVFGNSDYYNFSPLCNIDSKIEDSKLIIYSDEINLGNNQTLIDMLFTNEAKLIAEVYCSYTMYRRVFVQEFSYNIEIPLDNLKNKVEAIFMIIANQDIPNYSNSSVRNDAQDMEFYIEKGEVLAYFGEFSFELDLKGMGLESIVKIRSKESSRTSDVEYIYSEESIIIELPKNDYEALKKYVYNVDFQKLLVSSILQTALIHACYKLSNDQYDEKNWFRALRIHWQKSHHESHFPEVDEVAEFVENLLKQPSHMLVKTLEDLDSKNKNFESY